MSPQRFQPSRQLGVIGGHLVRILQSLTDRKDLLRIYDAGHKSLLVADDLTAVPD